MEEVELITYEVTLTVPTDPDVYAPTSSDLFQALEDAGYSVHVVERR